MSHSKRRSPSSDMEYRHHSSSASTSHKSTHHRHRQTRERSREREKSRGKRVDDQDNGFDRGHSHRSRSTNGGSDRRNHKIRQRHNDKETDDSSRNRRQDGSKTSNERSKDSRNDSDRKSDRRYDRSDGNQSTNKRQPTRRTDSDDNKRLKRYLPKVEIKVRREEEMKDKKGFGLCSPTEGESSKIEENLVKEKPNFVPSGKLAEDTNTYRGVVIKYNEPPDAHMSKLRWRLYPFKNDQALPVLYIHRQSAYLIGRDRKIADISVDHPSCSKQHAVFQYRMISVDQSDGTTVRRVRPYIIDLGSANGTYLNDERIEPQRFVELREKDVLKFGYSTREFVLLNEKSLEEENTIDVKREPQSP